MFKASCLEDFYWMVRHEADPAARDNDGRTVLDVKVASRRHIRYTFLAGVCQTKLRLSLLPAPDQQRLLAMIPPTAKPGRRVLLTQIFADSDTLSAAREAFAADREEYDSDDDLYDEAYNESDEYDQHVDADELLAEVKRSSVVTAAGGR